MWPDNETDLDFLNFSGVSDTVAEIIVQASGRPISIGIVSLIIEDFPIPHAPEMQSLQTRS